MSRSFPAAEVIAKIEYPKFDSQKQDDPHIRSYIERFISSSSSERLKEVYSTGAYYLPNKKINVVASRRNNFSTESAVLK